MASWKDGPDYAPIERPDGFAAPIVAPLTNAVPKSPTPTIKMPAPLNYQPAPQNIFNMSTPNQRTNRDPHQPFFTNTVLSSGNNPSPQNFSYQIPAANKYNPKAPITLSTHAQSSDYRERTSQISSNWAEPRAKDHLDTYPRLTKPNIQTLSIALFLMIISIVSSAELGIISLFAGALTIITKHTRKLGIAMLILNLAAFLWALHKDHSAEPFLLPRLVYFTFACAITWALASRWPSKN